MEGFILDSLLGEVSDNMDKKQFALLNKSTTQALVYFLHRIHPSLNKGDCLARLFFADFRKDFDLVDHNVIIAELENLEINPVIVRWIKDFLTDREQCVKLCNSTSSWNFKRLNGGLPQGTFVIYNFIISLLVEWHGRIKFVDDSSILEIIPWCSPSLLPNVVNDISNFETSVFMHTGTGDQGKIISVDVISKGITHELSSALPGFHAFTVTVLLKRFV